MSLSYCKQEIYPLTRRWLLLAVLCTTPLFALVTYLGDLGRARAAYVCAVAVLVAIRSFWGLRKRVWFWLTVTMVVFLHVPLIVFIPWGSERVPVGGLLPVGLADFGIAYGIIRLVERAMNRGTPDPEQ